MEYKVLVVEDQEMPRQLFEIFINSSENFVHAGSVANAEAVITILERCSVDLILMDVMTELGKSGLEVASKVKAKYPDTKLIIVTSMPEYSWLKRAKEIGVDSFWYKDGKKEDILNVMERTMAGERVFPDDTPLVSIGNTTNHDFTDRELEVLKELTTGDSNAEIGERLCISAGTVKYHIQNLLDKTGYKTRTELASNARSLGIVIK